MRRGKGYRLNLALSRAIPSWVPPPGERDGVTSPYTGYGRKTLAPDHEDALFKQALRVCQEQGTWSGWGDLPYDVGGLSQPLVVTRRTLTDAMIAEIRDDAVSNELFEQLAMRGEDAEALLVEEEADPDLPAPLYSTRWARVPDAVFEQYAPLAQRRPAP